MKTITLVSIHSNRPDFIKLQYESAKKYLKDDFEYIVANNSHYADTDKPQEIMEEAALVGRHLVVPHEKRIDDISYLMAETLNYLWEEFRDTKGILAIMDGDLFFTNPISFNTVLEDHDMAFCPIYTHGKVWPWTGLMLFDMEKIKVGHVNFLPSALDGNTYSDVGSSLSHYIQIHRPNVRLLDRKEIMNNEWPLKGKETTHTLGFPTPYSIDVVSMYQYPFLFHYKTSSNYAPHCTPEYNEKKTEALKKLCSTS